MTRGGGGTMARDLLPWKHVLGDIEVALRGTHRLLDGVRGVVGLGAVDALALRTGLAFTIPALVLDDTTPGSTPLAHSILLVFIASDPGEGRGD